MSQKELVNPSIAHREFSAAKVGLSVNCKSPFASIPLVMLKGLPEEAMMNGFIETLQGNVKLPKMVKLCLIS